MIPQKAGLGIGQHPYLLTTAAQKGIKLQQKLTNAQLLQSLRVRE